MKTSLPHPLAAMLAAGLWLACTAAPAQQAGTVSPASPTAPAASMAATPDMKFMKNAAQGGMAEVQAGELAASQGTHPQVRSFGQQMVADHGKANQELMTLASAKGMQLPAGPDNKHKKALAKLKGSSGASFDRAYADQMVKDHQQTLDLFRNTAASAKDADVKAFAAKTVPTLEHHLQMAQALQAAVK